MANRILQAAIQALLNLLVYALPLWLPSGLRAWPTAWVFLALWYGFWLAILAWLYRKNPGLFHERMQIRTPDQKSWDRLVGPLVYVALFAWLLFIAFDVTRLHWSPVPVWLQGVGGLVLLGSFYLFFATFRENAYLSPLVRVQKERGQTVISTGPYHFVRHPMYAATLVFAIGTPLLLGAWYGILAGGIVGLVLGWRSVLEERTLRQELSGYAEYMDRVKYRLIPHVW